MARPKGSKDTKPRKPRSRRQADTIPPRVEADNSVPPPAPKKQGRQYLPSEELGTPRALRNPHPIRPKAPPPPPGTKHPPHRPPIYSEALATEILDLMSVGHSVHEICSRDGMPTVDTIWRWRWSNPVFSEQYDRARDRRAEIQALRVEELADEKPLTYVDAQGIERIDPAWAQVQKLRIDTRKWIASRLVPRFSDHITVDGNQNHVHSIAQDTQKFMEARDRALARWESQGHIEVASVG